MNGPTFVVVEYDERELRRRYRRDTSWWGRLLGRHRASGDAFRDGYMAAHRSVLGERQWWDSDWWGWTSEQGGQLQLHAHGDGTASVDLAFAGTRVCIRLSAAELASLGEWASDVARPR